MAKYVMFYGGAMAAGHNLREGSETPAELMAKLMQHFPAHRARLDEFAAAGKLLMVGTCANPLEDGSMSVFRTSQDAEEFIAGDPFQLNGLIRSWRLLEWNETQVP